MSKIFFLLATVCFAIFALAGCGAKITGNTTTAANQNTAGNTATTAKTDEPPAVILKPGDVTPDKAVKVLDLVNSVVASKDGWKGKEVTVTAYVSAVATSGKNVTLTLLNDQTASFNKNMSCTFQGEKPEGIFQKTIEVKGKINYINTEGENKSVSLDPCDIKK